MKHLLFAAAALLLVAGPANATFVIDTFDDTDSAAGIQNGTHDSALGAGNAITLDDPAGVATMRTLFGTPQSGVIDPAIQIVASGASSTMNVTLAANQTAWIEWALPNVDLEGSLVLDGFVLNSGTATYQVDIDGANAGTGNVQETLIHTRDMDSSTLRLTFTAGASGASIFFADSITSTPEPASMGLLGLAVCGGIAGWRRKRKLQKNA